MPVLQHDLEILKLSPVYLENHIALARCIDRIFPNLVVLIISGSPPFLKSGVGKETQEIYEGLQSTRKDQKKRDNVSISSMSSPRTYPVLRFTILQLEFPPRTTSHSDLRTIACVESSRDQ